MISAIIKRYSPSYDSLTKYTWSLAHLHYFTFFIVLLRTIAI